MLRGAKVTLRAVEREDLRFIWGLRNDERTEALTYGPPKPQSMAEMEAWFERALVDEGSYTFVVEADGAPVGRCNLRDMDPVNRRADIGISLAPDQTGKGYGSDAIRVLLDFAFRHLNLHKVCADTLASNEASLRMCRACGFVEEGHLRRHEWFDGSYVDLVQLGILRDEWLVER